MLSFLLHQLSISARPIYKCSWKKSNEKRHTLYMLKKSVIQTLSCSVLITFFIRFMYFADFFFVFSPFYILLHAINLIYIDLLSLFYILSHLIIFIFCISVSNLFRSMKLSCLFQSERWLSLVHSCTFRYACQCNDERKMSEREWEETISIRPKKPNKITKKQFQTRKSGAPRHQGGLYSLNVVSYRVSAVNVFFYFVFLWLFGSDSSTILFRVLNCTNVLLLCAFIFFVRISFHFFFSSSRSNRALVLISFLWKQKTNSLLFQFLLVISYNYRCAAKHQSFTQRRYESKCKLFVEVCLLFHFISCRAPVGIQAKHSEKWKTLFANFELR